jgi:hypothetical protein
MISGDEIDDGNGQDDDAENDGSHHEETDGRNRSDDKVSEIRGFKLQNIAISAYLNLFTAVFRYMV